MRRFALLGLAMLVGCSSPSTQADATTGDAGGSDARVGDGGASDASTTTDIGTSDAGAVGCAPAPMSATLIDVTEAPYHAMGDGATDATGAIQMALDAANGGVVLVPDGIYMIDATRALRPRSNTTLRLSSGAILRAILTTSANYDVVRIDHVSNVTVIGGTIEGDRAHHTGTGEWGMGLSIHASQHVVIDGVTARLCWGDGFYVTEASSDVTMCNLVSDGNRRQGMSVTGVDHLRVIGSTFSHTGGTLPEDGVDIEPNVGETVNDVVFSHCTFTDNAGFGFEDGVPIANTGMAFITNFTIDSCEVARNGTMTMSTSPRSGFGISNVTGHVITNCSSHENVGDGFLLRNGANMVTVDHCTSDHNGGNGIENYLCTNDVITNDVVTNNGAHGIYSPSSTGTVTMGNTVTGNAMMP